MLVLQHEIQVGKAGTGMYIVPGCGYRDRIIAQTFLTIKIVV
jgi:hypothetical protein